MGSSDIKILILDIKIYGHLGCSSAVQQELKGGLEMGLRAGQVSPDKNVRKNVWGIRTRYLIFSCLKMLEIRVEGMPHSLIIYEFSLLLKMIKTQESYKINCLVVVIHGHLNCPSLGSSSKVNFVIREHIM